MLEIEQKTKELKELLEGILIDFAFNPQNPIDGTKILKFLDLTLYLDEELPKYKQPLPIA